MASRAEKLKVSLPVFFPIEAYALRPRHEVMLSASRLNAIKLQSFRDRARGTLAAEHERKLPPACSGPLAL